MKDEVKFVHAFVIAFKETDDRLTGAMTDMIKIFEKMFGHDFWNNVILEATHWNFHESSIRKRKAKDELSMDYWSSTLNKWFHSKYSLPQGLQLPSVFIDTFYDPNNPDEKEMFESNTKKLWDFASDREPFECKDIKIALTEIGQLENEITNLENQKKNQTKKIEALTARIDLLETRITYTLTEFSLFGVGLCILGVVIGVLLVAYMHRDKETRKDDGFYSDVW